MRNNTLLRVLTPALVLLALAACGGGASAASHGTADKLKACIEPDSDPAWSLEDYIDTSAADGTIIIDGTFSKLASPSELDCALDKALEVPASVRARMGQTRALDGMQEAEYKVGGKPWKISWNYHPDHGLSIVAGPA